MPKCLFKYQWVKLPRTHLPVGKGIMGYWAKLASRAAFRKGRAKYCGYTNDVMPGMWSGGVVGLKSSLRNRRLWLSLPSPQHHAAPCGSALYIRRIRCMAGPLVPHSIRRTGQCVFFYSAGCSIRQLRRHINDGKTGSALGLGKDKGVEIFSEEWGCLRSAPSAGLLRLPHFQ